MQHSSFVLSNLNKQRQEGEFCDVLLKVENQEFHAHKNVLAASSQYFQKMFTVEMKEKYEKVVCIDNVSIDAMKTLLEFIYTGNFAFTKDNAIEIFDAAAFLCLSNAMELMADFFGNSLDLTNCFLLHQFSVEHSVENLLLKTSKFIAENIQEIVSQEAYLNFSAKELEQILYSDDLEVKEEKQVYECVLKWINKDTISRKRNFSKLFSQVRLQHIPLEFIADVIRKNELVREFPDCRDSIENVLFFRINPQMIAVQYPRSSYVPKPDSLILVYSSTNYQGVVGCHNSKIKIQAFDNWEPNLVTNDSAVAIKYPFAVFCGGLDTSKKVLDRVVLFNGRCWNRLPSLITPRCGCTAVYHKKDLFVFGGEKSVISQEESFVDKENTFNPRKETDFANDFEVLHKNWSVVGKLLIPRSYATASVVNEEIYLIGGYMLSVTPAGRKFCSGNRLKCKETSNSTHIYNVQKKSWEIGPSMKISRAGSGSAVLDSTIFVVGGYGLNCSSILIPEFLNISSGVWTCVVSGSPLHTYFSKVCCINDQIYVSGISNCSLLRYDPRARTWSTFFNNVHDAGAFIIPFSNSYYESCIKTK